MRCKILFTAAVFLIVAPFSLLAQNLDGKPYTPGVDADISFYLCNWKNSQPVISHGSLIEREIFSRGDPLKPSAKGKILKYMNRFTYAELSSGSVTSPTKLSGEQELFYILSGKGVIKTSKTTAELYPGIAVLVPAGCEFTMASTDPKNTLTLYLVNEPIPAGFRPNDDIKVTDVDASPVGSRDVHWCHQWRSMFFTEDGFGTIESTGTVTFDPMTIGHPHSHEYGCEEIWAAIEGDSYAFIGKQIFLQTPGMAFLIPPDGKTPHSTINTSDKQIRMLYIARYRDHEVRK